MQPLPAAPPDDPFQLCGTTLQGKYRISSLVGSGGFGVVYRGVHTAFDEPIAVKCLRVPADLDEASRKELLHQLAEEGAVLHRLSKRCAAIVQALDVSAVTTQSGVWVPFLVLEWLEGQTLADYLLQRRIRADRAPALPLSEAIGLLAPAAEALALAHRQKVAHRDVKPENLYLTEEDGTRGLKILDFGIAKILASHGRFTASPAATQAQPSAFTPLYGAPEQFNKRLGATGPWTDVFALALILVELLTGEQALLGDDPAQLYVAATELSKRPLLAELDAPAALEGVLRRAFAVEPQDRYPDAGAFWQALRRAAGPSDPSVPDMSETGDFVLKRSMELAPVMTELSGSCYDGRTAGGADADSSRAAITPRVVISDSGEVAAGGTDSGPAPGSTPDSLAPTQPVSLRDQSFDIAVTAMASESITLTVPNVVARLNRPFDEVERELTRMVAEGRLVVHAHDELGSMVYRVKGLTVPPPSKLKPVIDLAMRLLHINPAIEPILAPEKCKSVPVGVVLGVLIPGLGLVYGAPLSSALVVTILGALSIALIREISLVGPLLAWLATVVAIAVSGILGGAYVWHYNRHAQRTAMRALRYRRRP